MCEHHALQLGIAMVVYLNGLMCSFPQLHIYRTNKLVPSSPHPHSHASPTANSKKNKNWIYSSLETKVTQLNLWLVCLCVLSLKQICSEHLAIKVVNKTKGQGYGEPCRVYHNRTVCTDVRPNWCQETGWPIFFLSSTSTVSPILILPPDCRGTISWPNMACVGPLGARYSRRISKGPNLSGSPVAWSMPVTLQR